MKHLYVLLALILMLPANSVMAVNNETEESSEVEQSVDEELRLVDNYIFAEDFPEDYTKWTESEYVNKLIYAMEDYFGWKIEEEEIRILGDGQLVALYPSELADGRGNEIGLLIDEEQINIFFAREWKDVEEKEYYATAIIEMLTDSITREENVEIFERYQMDMDEFLTQGFPAEAMQAIENNLAYVSIPAIPGEHFDSIHYVYISGTEVYNDNMLYIIGYLNPTHEAKEEEGTYTFSLDQSVEPSAEVEQVPIFVEDPVFVEEESN